MRGRRAAAALALVSSLVVGATASAGAVSASPVVDRARPVATAAVAGVTPPGRCAGAELAPSLRRSPDTNPDGSAVRITPSATGTYVPVVMVHGWTSRATHDDGRRGAFSALIDLSANRSAPVRGTRSLVGQLQGVPGTAVYTFDYHQYSGRWVTDPHIGDALGSAIDCLHRTYGQKVVVVGHSMGGLAAREALTRPGPGGADRAREVSQIITFGTPQTGSIAATVLAAGVDGAAAANSRYALVLRTLMTQCGRVSSRRFDSGSLCDLLGDAPKAFSGDAGRALRAGSRELAALRTPRVPVHALAGETSFRVPDGTGWFGLGWKTQDVAGAGDMIVTSRSATRGAVDSRLARCTYQLSVPAAVAEDIGTGLRLVAPGDRAAAPVGSFTGPCFHTSLMRNRELTNDALALVAEDVEGRQPVSVDALLRAPVPALCGHPAGDLSDGLLDVPGENSGGTWIGDAEGSVPAEDYELADVTGDGVGDAAVVVSCNLGGVPWPQSVQFYTGGTPTRLGGLSLETLSDGDRDVVTDLSPIRNGVHVRWRSNRDSDYGCCPTTSWEADLTYLGGEVVASEVRRYDEVASAEAFVAAAAAGDTATMGQYADPQVVADTEQVAAFLPDLGDAEVTCHGGEFGDDAVPDDVLAGFGLESWPPDGDTELYGLRYCVARTPSGTQPVLGMQPDGWNSWKVVMVSVPD